MSSVELLTVITIMFYLCASVIGIAGMIWRKGGLRKGGCWLALAAFFCQTLILVFGFHKLMPTGLTLGAYLQLLAWFFLLCGIGAWQRIRQDAILLFAAPLGLCLFLVSAPWLNLSIPLPPSLSAPFYALHIGSLFLSLGLVTLGFMAGLIFLFLQRRLKAKKNMKGIWEDMPAISILDKINSVCAIGAFPLYTIGLFAGLFWARPVFGATVSGDAKEIVSLGIWIMLGILFYNRLNGNWCGRKPAILLIVIFILSVISIFFVNMLLSVHHGFPRN